MHMCLWGSVLSFPKTNVRLWYQVIKQANHYHRAPLQMCNRKWKWAVDTITHITHNICSRVLTQHAQVCTVGLYRQTCVCALCLCAFNSCQVVYVCPPIVTHCSLRDMLIFDSELSVLVYKYAANNINHSSSSIISAHCNLQLIKYWLFVMARHTSSKNKFLLYTPKVSPRRTELVVKTKNHMGFELLCVSL